MDQFVLLVLFDESDIQLTGVLGQEEVVPFDDLMSPIGDRKLLLTWLFAVHFECEAVGIGGFLGDLTVLLLTDVAVAPLFSL